MKNVECAIRQTHIEKTYACTSQILILKVKFYR